MCPIHTKLVSIVWTVRCENSMHHTTMFAKISRGSHPAGLFKYLFGPGKHNEHRNQHLINASPDLLKYFDFNGKPTTDFTQIAHQFDTFYRALRRKGEPYAPDASTPKYNPEMQDGYHRVWHVSLSIKAEHGVLTDEQWHDIIIDFLKRMNIIQDENDTSAQWLAVRHGLNRKGNDHVHIAVNLAKYDEWVNAHNDFKHAKHTCRAMEKTHEILHELQRDYSKPAISWRYSQWRQWAEWKAEHDWNETHSEQWNQLKPTIQRQLIASVATQTMPRMHVARIVEACAIASHSEDEFIRRIRREGFQIDPFLRKGTTKDMFNSITQVTGYRITWRSKDGWTERFNAHDLGSELRLKALRKQWRTTPQDQHMSIAEWKAVMQNKPPAITNGAEKQFENLSTHDLSRLIDIAFCAVQNLSQASDDEYKTVLTTALRDFDIMRSRYGLDTTTILPSLLENTQENQPPTR